MHFETDTDGWSPQGPVTELTELHAWSLLESRGFGRLALSMDDRPQIFPLNFVATGSTVVFRTGAGAKLRELLHNRHVAFEADEVNEEGAWSVVIRGLAEVLEDDQDIRAADALPLPHWTPTLEYVYVRITPTDIRGRRFERHLRAERLVAGSAS